MWPRMGCSRCVSTPAREVVPPFPCERSELCSDKPALCPRAAGPAARVAYAVLINSKTPEKSLTKADGSADNTALEVRFTGPLCMGVY